MQKNISPSNALVQKGISPSNALVQKGINPGNVSVQKGIIVILIGADINLVIFALCINQKGTKYLMPRHWVSCGYVLTTWHQNGIKPINVLLALIITSIFVYYFSQKGIKAFIKFNNLLSWTMIATRVNQ